MPATARLCDRCGVRWKQDGEWCRRCADETGQTRTAFERERDRVARQQAAIVRVGPPLPHRELTLNGVIFEVMFDGS